LHGLPAAAPAVRAGKINSREEVYAMKEGQLLDKKSIRYVLSKHKDAKALAADCVGFANASGGVIALGIEDDAGLPPED